MSVVWLEKNGGAQCTNGHLNHTRGLGRFLEEVTWALRSEKMTSYCAPLDLLPEPAMPYSMWLTIMGQDQGKALLQLPNLRQRSP